MHHTSFKYIVIFDLVKCMTYRVFMHRNSIDVCFVLRNDDLVNAVGDWFNLGYTGSPWFLSGVKDLVDLTKPEWVDITDRFYTVRTKPGLP